MSLPSGKGCGRTPLRSSQASHALASWWRSFPGIAEPAVRRAAEMLGIHKWRANVSPTDKVARVEDLTSRGYKVLMVGDGSNDAPALAAAHASMSPVTATHVSQAVADAVFLGEHLGPVMMAFAAADAAESLSCCRLQRPGRACCERRLGDAAD